jgi:N utilization substance protein A
MTPEMLVTLGEKGIKTLDNLGDLAGDELREILPNSRLSVEDANAIIMAARAHWFEEPPAAGPAA